MLIGNDCLAAFIYKRYNVQFDNPFMWTYILPDQYIKLVNKFDTLNFSNIQVYNIKKSKNYQEYYNILDLVKEFNSVQYCVCIDKKVELLFLHYIEDDKYNTPQKIKSEVYYNNIPELITKHYNNRILRMKDKKPTFIFNVNSAVKFPKVKEFLSLKGNKIVCTAYPQFITNDVMTIKKNKRNENVKAIAQRLTDEQIDIFFRK